nr:hypothetical protein [Halomonas sp.]
MFALFISLVFSLWEVLISINALNVQLQDLEGYARACQQRSGSRAEED